MITIPYVNFSELSKKKEKPSYNPQKGLDLKLDDIITIKLSNGETVSGEFKGYWGEEDSEGIFVDDCAIDNNDIVSIKNEIDEVLKLAGIKLTEGIEEIKKYYPLISEKNIRKLISLDPTYNGGNELGTYGKWILNLFNNYMKDKVALDKWQEQKAQGNNYPKPIKKSQERLEDFLDLIFLLKKFDSIKNKAKLNINNIKSVAELYSTIQNATADNNVSENKQVQHSLDLVNKSVSKGGEIVFRNNKWIILVPKTYESSKVFGDDTNWCTTSHNGEYYNHYLDDYGGQYFINVNLHNGSLYQFHFESKQFMDSSDNEIDLEGFAENNPDLKQFYRNYILTEADEKVKDTVTSWVWLNPEDITEEMKLTAVKEDGYALQFIKNPSEELKLLAVKQNGYAIQFINKPSEQIQLESVKEEGTSIKYIVNPSEKVQLLAVKTTGYAIGYIKNPSEKVQIEAVNQDADSIKYIKNPTEKVKALWQKLYRKKIDESISNIDNQIDEILKLAGVK